MIRIIDVSFGPKTGKSTEDFSKRTDSLFVLHSPYFRPAFQDFEDLTDFVHRQR